MIYSSFSEDETKKIGEDLGNGAKAGQVFCLIGDLGVGKTQFTQGFAKGLGITEYVNSPTFTIVSQYDTGRLMLYHMDVYRISCVDEMYDIDYEDMVYDDGVCLIEWANLIEDILPEKYTNILIEKDLEKGFDYRRITITEVGA